jgi:hypothetical protein
MLKQELIHGNYVSYESGEKNIMYGIRHLDHVLSAEEAQVFFRQAKEKKSAQFEDKNRYQFTLVYQNGKFLLLSRK